MRLSCLIASVLLLGSFSPPARGTGGVDSRVVQVRMPDEDVEVTYIESNPFFTVGLTAKSAKVEVIDSYVGDGKIAVKLTADASEGIFFQGKKLPNGHVLKKGSTVKVLPGYKRAVDLEPGTVYITLPGVTFQVPEK